MRWTRDYIFKQSRNFLENLELDRNLLMKVLLIFSTDPNPYPCIETSSNTFGHIGSYYPQKSKHSGVLDQQITPTGVHWNGIENTQSGCLRLCYSLSKIFVFFFCSTDWSWGRERSACWRILGTSAYYVGFQRLMMMARVEVAFLRVHLTNKGISGKKCRNVKKKVGNFFVGPEWSGE